MPTLHPYEAFLSAQRTDNAVTRPENKGAKKSNLTSPSFSKYPTKNEKNGQRVFLHAFI